MGRYRWRDFNFYLFGSMLVLIGFSLLMVYSTMVGKNAISYSGFRNHLIWLTVGGVCMVGMMLFDYRNLQVFGKFLYVLMLALLGVVFALGISRQGAQSWVGFQNLSFQPSEPAKLLLIITLAGWWSAREQKTTANSWITLIGSLMLAGLPLLMVLDAAGLWHRDGHGLRLAWDGLGRRDALVSCTGARRCRCSRPDLRLERGAGTLPEGAIIGLYEYRRTTRPDHRSTCA